MRKKFTLRLIISVLLFPSLHTLAQSDSLLDLGRIRISKEFTQSITIKGSDLEQIPFASLTDAIAPWLEGALSTRTNLVFVVDGNLVNDVDAWPIYEIEEITLVQNAMVQVNGTTKQQELVLVKTKKNAGKSGLTLAGGSFLVKNKFDPQGNLESKTNTYHQYHINVWQNGEKVQYGLSANILRDVSPLPKTGMEKIETSPQLNRYRFNGWMNISLAKGHSVTARLNYVPQQREHEYAYAPINELVEEYYKGKPSLINPSIRFANQLAPGLTHEIDLSYLSARNPYNSQRTVHYYDISAPYDQVRSTSAANDKMTNLLIRQRISYSRNWGDWLLEPSLSFTYRHLKLHSEISSTTFYDGVPSNNSAGRFYTNAEFYVLTPAFNFSYKNSFNFVGGIAAGLGNDNKPLGDGVFPFASLTFDVLRIRDAENPNSLQLFASYAGSADFSDRYFLQDDLASLGTVDPSFFSSSVTMNYPENAARHDLHAGAGFSLREYRLQVNYTFTGRQYPDLVLREIPSGGTTTLAFTWPAHNFTSHRLGLLSRLIKKPGVQWLMGLNVTTFKVKYDEGASFGVTVSNNDKAAWTGGWTNRLQWGRFIMGLDILYLLNEQRPSLAGNSFEKFNNWSLNSFYAGLRFDRKRSPFEIYLSARNSLQNDSPYFTDNRRFYGAGFKWQL
jgi:hypothetical protein